MTTVCYAGSFDPVHNGHIDVIGRVAPLFERVIVGVLANPDKKHLFAVEERLVMLRDSIDGHANVELKAFEGLTVEFCVREGASIIIRGLRAVSDFDYEMAMAQMNARMGVETMFMPTNPVFSYVQSRLMKEVVHFGGSIEGLVPPAVAERLEERLRPQG